MERIEIIAKTVDDAIAKALQQLNTTRENISVRIVEEGSKGIFGLGVKDAKIVVSIKDGVTAEPETTATLESTSQKEDKLQQKPDFSSVQDKTKEFVSELIKKMDINCNVDCVAEEDNLKVIITGEDVGTAIGRRGETLDAIQYITNLYVNKGKHGDDYIRVIVDTENYRKKREDTLVRLANSMASKAVKYRKDMSLEPMNPYERRIIHATLQSHKYVKTRSVGDEPNRRIIISLKR